MKSLSWFLGRKIISVGFTYENVWVEFEDQHGATIYNTCSLADDFHPSRYIGAKITMERWSSEQLYLELDNGDKIVVDLRDAAWSGPEALLFADGKNVRMVVNEQPDETTTYPEEAGK